ncbi:MAG: Gfo/Idh/MocA family oxidoreductase [Phycisphaerae bacterium]|nr:Gfo/Idh/MocA family oxidoreductase [Phycisphaerae bacterium]
MTPVSWAVIGCGRFAQARMLPALAASPLAAPHTLVGRDADRLRPVAERFGAARVADDLAEAAADPEVEAIYIATPVFRHASDIRICLQAGKAVLCEKPLALDLSEAEALRRDVLDSGLLFMEGYMLRFHGAHLLAKEIIATGKLGQLTYGEFDASFWYPPAGVWRQRWDQGGGGGLMDVGSHAIHLVESLVGPVVSVQALTGSQVHEYEVDDGATLLLHVRPDVHVVVRAAFNARPGRSHWRIAGTLGELTATGTIGQSPDGLLSGRLVNPESGDPTPCEHEYAYDHVNTYQAMLEAFCRTLRQGRPRCVNHIDESVSVIRVIDAAYRSSREGRRIDLAT